MTDSRPKRAISLPTPLRPLIPRAARPDELVHPSRPDERRMDGLVEEFYVSGTYKRVLFLTNKQAEVVKEETTAIARLLKELQAPPQFASPL